MIKIIEYKNLDYIDRQCWANSVNYWIRKGYKAVNIFTKDDTIVAVLDDGKVK